MGTSTIFSLKNVATKENAGELYCHSPNSKGRNEVIRKHEIQLNERIQETHGVSALLLGSVRCQKSSRKKCQKQAKRWLAEKVIVRVGEQFRAIFFQPNNQKSTEDWNEENILWVSAKVSLASRCALPHHKWINEVKRKWIRIPKLIYIIANLAKRNRKTVIV